MTLTTNLEDNKKDFSAQAVDLVKGAVNASDSFHENVHDTTKTLWHKIGTAYHAAKAGVKEFCTRYGDFQAQRCDLKDIFKRRPQ